MWALLKQTFNEFIEDDCMAMAAAVAYYTMFSLPPLLLIVVAVAGAFFGTETVSQKVQQEAGAMIGHGAATEIQTMLRGAREQTGSAGQAAIGIIVLLFGATTAFAQLQSALNRTWKVKPDPQMSTLQTIRQFLSKRLLSFGLILVIGFLLLVSLVISAALAWVGQWLEGAMGGGLWSPILLIANFVVSLGIISALFAAMFKYLPDAQIPLSDVVGGALLTAVLFTVGKFLLGFYFGASDVAAAYGAAGSTILILVWIYYSSMILLFGAEFTHAYSSREGHQAPPEPGAVRETPANSRQHAMESRR